MYVYIYKSAYHAYTYIFIYLFNGGEHIIYISGGIVPIMWNQVEEQVRKEMEQENRI